MHVPSKLRLISILSALVALSLVLVACGDDDGETTATGPLTLDGEETVLALDSKTAKVLAKSKLAVSPVDPSSVGGEGIGFPIVGGEIDAESLAGTIDHAGGIKFSSGGARVKLTDFVVDTEVGTLTASTPDGPDLLMLDLDLSGLERTDEGGEIVLSGITASLSEDGAAALNRALDVELFEGGLAIGEITMTATAI